MKFSDLRWFNIALCFFLVFCCINTGLAQEGEGIIQQYRKALEMNPDDMDARYLLAVALLREKSYKEAITHILKVYPSRAGEAEINYNLGLAYMGNRELQKAFRQFKIVDDINAVEARDRFHLDAAYYNLGISFQREGNLDEALKAYQEAIQINPEQSDAYCAKGEVLYQKNDYNTALENLTTCRSRNPDRKGINRFISSIYQARGSEYIKQKRYTDARIEFEQSVTLDPANEINYYYMGYLEYLDGKYNKALSFLEKMKGTDREDMKKALASMLYNIGGAFQKEENWQGVVKAFSMAVEISKDDPEIFFYLGYGHMKMGEYDPAVSAFKETMRLDPRHQKAAINMAIVAELSVKSHLAAGEDHLKSNSYNEALKEYNYVLSMDSKNQKGLEGKETSEKGVVKLKKEAAEKRDMEIAGKLLEGERYIADGKYQLAKRMFESIFSMDPGNKKAQEALQRTDTLLKEATTRHLSSGEKAFTEGRYYVAILEYGLALEYNPEDKAAAERLQESQKRLSEQITPVLIEARRHEDAERLPEALAAYNRILEMQPDNKEAIQGKAKVSDRYDKAFNEALSQGREAVKAGELMKGAEYLGRALELKPDNEIAIEEFGKISGKLKKIIEIRLADAASALKTGKYGDAVANYRAVLLLDKGNKEASAGLQSSTKLRDEGMEKKMTAGVNAYRDGNYFQAIASFGEVLQIDSGNAEALKLQRDSRAKIDELVAPWLKTGVEAYKKGDMNTATASFKKIINVDPGNRDAREYLGRLGTEKAKASVAGEIEKHYLKGIELYTNGKYKEALGEWRKVLELDPKHERSILNIEKAKRKMEGVMDTK